MKNKLTINSLAKNNIKHRKKQYTLMIIGILLSMIFSSTAVFFASSMVTSTSEYYKNNFGNCDSIFYHENADDDLLKQAQEQNIIGEYAYAHVLGRIYPEKNSEELNLNIAYLDESAKEFYYVSLLEGKYPTESGEIALEKATLEQINPDLKIGDVFTVYMKGQNDKTHLDGLEEKTYRLVGILRNKRSNILRQEGVDPDFIPSAFVSDDSDMLPGSKEAKVAYLDIIERDVDEYNWYEFQSNAGLYGESPVQMEIHLFSSKDQFTYTDTFTIMVLVVIFGVVLILASFVGIINAMNSNIADRKKQIGMLRTVGATKRQIRKIFGREAIIIALICVPVSLLVAFVAVKSISGFFGEDFVFTLNIPVLILSGIFSVICVAVSSLIPLHSASKISPVQSIRNIDITRKMKAKNIKSKKEFNVSKLLAKRNLTFYRKKQAIVSVFLIVTIVSSCLGFSFLKTAAKYMEYEYDYMLYASTLYYNGLYNEKTGSTTGYNENLKQSIWNMNYFDSISSTRECVAAIEVDGYSNYIELLNKASFAFTDQSEEQINKIKADFQTNKELFPLHLKSLDNDAIEELEQYVGNGKIDIDKLNRGEEVILLAPDKIGYQEEIRNGDVFTFGVDFDDKINENEEYVSTAERTINVDDTYDLGVIFTNDYDCQELEFVKNEVKISAHIKDLPDAEKSLVGYYSEIVLVTTHEGMNKLTDNKVGYDALEITLKDEYKDSIDEELDSQIKDRLDILTMNITNHNYVSSSYDVETSNNLTFTMLFIGILSIMVLLLAGSISIINNSLTARIRENKREMGTLRAVGATQKDLTISYVRQLISMFGWGTGLGFGIFFMVFFGIKIRDITRAANEIPTNLDPCIWPAIVATIILFVTCSLNLYFKIKKETKNSIIDNIREL